MKTIRIIIILFLVTFYSKNAFAVSLSEALLQAYKNNPELNAERENIKVSKQDLKISKSEFFPSVTLSGSKSQEDTDKLTNQSEAMPRLQMLIQKHNQLLLNKNYFKDLVVLLI